MDQKKINEIVEHFNMYPTTYSNSYSRLMSQFRTDEQTIKQAKLVFINQTPEKMSTITKSTQEVKFNIESGEKELKLTTDKNISTPEELFQELDIDSEKWICVQFWSIIKNGKYNISALIKLRNEHNYLKDIKEYTYVETKSLQDFEPSKEKSTLIVYLSDRHIGAKTKENSILDNDYNEEVYKERMNLTLKEIFKLDMLYKFGNIVVIDLGDMIDGMNGETTRGGHKLPQNMNNREVYELFMDTELDFISSIYKHSNANLSRYSVGDSNHGGDFEWILNRSIERVLNSQYPEIDIYTGNKFIEHFFIDDHCFLICHGKDSEDMKHPLPKNLDDKTEKLIKSYIEHKGIKSKFIHFIKGDLHVSTSEYGRFFRYKNCPSLYGSSKWVMTNFMSNQKGVAFDIVTNNSLTEHYLFF